MNRLDGLVVLSNPFPTSFRAAKPWSLTWKKGMTFFIIAGEIQVLHVGGASCYFSSATEASFCSAPNTRSVNSARDGGQEAFVTARTTLTLSGTDNGGLNL